MKRSTSIATFVVLLRELGVVGMLKATGIMAFAALIVGGTVERGLSGLIGG